MERNVGRADKVVRIVLGIAIISCGIYYKSWWGLIGLIPLLTGLLGVCLLYKVFGINTCKTR
jgi:hypothetical protein